MLDKKVSYRGLCVNLLVDPSAGKQTMFSIHCVGAAKEADLMPAITVCISISVSTDIMYQYQY